MKFRLNIKGKVVHGPDCGETCNLDDADEVRTVSFRAAATAYYADNFQVCERLDDDPKEESQDGK